MSENNNFSKSIANEDLDITTQLSIQRTILANTRTFSSWIRTGLSSVLAGLAIVKFLGSNSEHELLVSIIGISFVVIGIGIYIYGYYHYKKSNQKLNESEHNLSLPIHIILVMTIGLVITSVLIVILLVLYK